MLGVIARVGGPSSLLDLDVDTFVAVLEGVVREDPQLAEVVDDLYSEAHALAAPPAPVDRASRRAEIRQAMSLFGAR